MASDTRTFTWAPKDKTLTGTFHEFEEVHLITKNLVKVEKGTFILKPVSTQINVVNRQGSNISQIYMDETWYNPTTDKEKHSQDVDTYKRNEYGWKPFSEMNAETNDDKMFGGGDGMLDLSSSMDSNEHFKLKYHKSKTAKCVEQCMRKGSTSRRTRRRPNPKHRK